MPEGVWQRLGVSGQYRASCIGGSNARPFLACMDGAMHARQVALVTPMRIGQFVAAVGMPAAGAWNPLCREKRFSGASVGAFVAVMAAWIVAPLQAPRRHPRMGVPLYA